MKKRLLALSVTAIVLAGCQDEPAETPQPEQKPAAQAETVVPEPTLEIEAQPQQQAEVMVDSAHNAQNSLDWNGTYSGILPCADCEGLETNLTLNTDGSYSLDQTYLGKGEEKYHSEGSFSWDNSGSVITLSDEAEPNQYFVAENELMKLDSNGQHITGELADQYNLTKK
ncbi:copper resistance protein NlpE [Vibrio proteolyticus]|uniref:Lipoprotein NlpE n=1 Tax=Vibrio proteolyticus NBRC 13287 TaxID=1219065 RepID=U3A0R7_VIBPR|nr:copper resistance protein NlpE N-terminal domain-containing protein [Vibrio proteolyticus]GAD66932.1 hypothetical protein VPR01S_05_02270 [Vibrio proteolyticus NBRC 13287]